MKSHDVVIIGGGHNGLVTAFYLAKAGFKPLVLERRDVVGGAAITDEFHPGFTCSTLAHVTGPLRSDIVRDLQLERYGLQIFRPNPRMFAPLPDGPALLLYDSAGRSANEIAKFSPRDATRYSEFQDVLQKLGHLIASVLATPPPSIDSPSLTDLWHLLRTGRRFHSLGRRNCFRLLRWVPMPVADLVAEWFETDLLRAIVAARGIVGTFMGPRSAGTGLALLLQVANNGRPVGDASLARGGLGAVTQAMAAAARAAGVEIRTEAEISQIAVRNGSASGVVLTTGEEIAARTVVSNADPKRTFLDLLDPTYLDPEFLSKVCRYRCIGTAAKVNLALGGLPDFRSLSFLRDVNGKAALSGRIHIGPGIDYLERAFDAAKHGDFSGHPYLDITIPSLTDPSLAPAGRHVMSIYMQFAPYTLKEGSWTHRGEKLADAVVRTLSAYAPRLESLILSRQVITPRDFETTYGLTGGHIFHGEPTLDQLYTMRPVLGWARYRTPIKGLYLCGSGTHPGGGVTGASGANASREILKDLRSGI